MHNISTLTFLFIKKKKETVQHRTKQTVFQVYLLQIHKTLGIAVYKKYII